MRNALFAFLALCAAFFAAAAPIQAEEESETIIVKLSTGSSLIPLYLGNFGKEQAGLPDDYIAKLQKILEFDLGHNGMTYLETRSPSKDEVVAQIKEGTLPPQDKLNTLEAYYIVKVDVRNQKLYATLITKNSQGSKKIDGIPLSWALKDDRKQIHLLADTIHRALFNSEGIATTRFLFTVKTRDSATNKPLSEVWEADYDGGNARQITRNMGYCVTPAYVPPKPGYSSGSCFYVSYLIGQPKIYMASLNGGEGQRFSPLKGNQFMPAISRQRDKVAFISDVTGNPDLFVQEFNPEQGAIGKPRQIFSTHLATQGTPTFSPDGKKVAFVSNKDGSAKIYMMDIPPEGADLKQVKAKLLTKHTKEGTAPCWSPDGTKIAYCSMTGGSRQIWVYDLEKNEERQLTQGKGHKENPTWAPNSLHLIFNSTDADHSELYLINLNQPEAVQISSGPGEKRFPSWEPRVPKIQ
jgi:TolB protein